MLTQIGTDASLSEYPKPADRLRALVEDIANAPRTVASSWHTHTRAGLETALKNLHLEPYAGQYRHSYDGKFCNLLGVLPGSKRGSAPILIAAHYDTVLGSPGADDNAAAIAIILELIPQLRGKLEQDLIVAFFDAEEPPYFLGS